MVLSLLSSRRFTRDCSLIKLFWSFCSLVISKFISWEDFCFALSFIFSSRLIFSITAEITSFIFFSFSMILAQWQPHLQQGSPSRPELVGNSPSPWNINSVLNISFPKLSLVMWEARSHITYILYILYWWHLTPNTITMSLILPSSMRDTSWQGLR